MLTRSHCLKVNQPIYFHYFVQNLCSCWFYWLITMFVANQYYSQSFHGLFDIFRHGGGASLTSLFVVGKKQRVCFKIYTQMFPTPPTEYRLDSSPNPVSSPENYCMLNSYISTAGMLRDLFHENGTWIKST